MSLSGADSAPNGRVVSDALPEPEVGERHLSTTRWLLVLAGLVAGLVAFGIGEVIYNIIPPELVVHDVSGNKVMLPTLATLIVAATKNSALTFGALGTCLGGALGFAGGLARRSTRRCARGRIGRRALGHRRGCGVFPGADAAAPESTRLTISSMTFSFQC